jgi:transposase-like protein
MSEEQPWRDPETMRRLYVNQRMTFTEIADELGCSNPTVERWIREHGIETRGADGYTRSRPASFYTGKRGHEVWTHQYDGESFDVYVHQLLAIAEGTDPYEVFSGGERVVHHKNGIPWANWPGNLEVMKNSEHMIHHRKEEYGDEPWRGEETLREAYRNSDSGELAERWGCSTSVIVEWLHRHGIDPDLNKPWRDWELVRSLCQEGHTPPEIAEMFDCDPKTIQNWLPKHGIKSKQVHRGRRGSTTEYRFNDG